MANDSKPEDQASQQLQARRKTAAKDTPTAAGQPETATELVIPPGCTYVIADETLFVHNPEAAAAPARAFNAGDRVPADLVARHGWGTKVHLPEWASALPADPSADSDKE